MKHFYIKNRFALFLSFAPLLLMEQFQLQYQLIHQGRDNFAGCHVEQSVTTSIYQNAHSLKSVHEDITALIVDSAFLLLALPVILCSLFLTFRCSTMNDSNNFLPNT
jgi:hypothetical protein